MSSSEKKEPIEKLIDKLRSLFGQNDPRKTKSDLPPKAQFSFLYIMVAIILFSYKSWFSNRFDIVSGLTGLWQVSGKNKLTFLEMIRLDIQYIRNQSSRTDLKIILLTPMAILQIVREK